MSCRLRGSAGGGTHGRADVPSRPPLAGIGRSLPAQAVALVAATWTVMRGGFHFGMTDAQAVASASAAGVLCVLAVWGACRSLGVRCEGGALLLAAVTGLAGLGMATREELGTELMVIVLAPGPLAWVVCWPGTARQRLLRLARGVVALPVAGAVLLAMFAVYTTPALLVLAAISLAPGAVLRAVRWTARAPERVMGVLVTAGVATAVLVNTVEDWTDLHQGLVLAELGAWLAAYLVLLGATAWPRLAPPREATDSMGRVGE